MKIITEYQCEVCKHRYSTEEQALACEKEGEFNPSNYPIGLMDEYEHNGYVGIFAIAKSEPFEHQSHLGTASMWAFRTEGYPPTSIDDNLCGGGRLLRNKDAHEWFSVSKEGLEKPEFQKMVDYLRSKNIVPKYYERKTKKLVTL